MPGNDAPSEDAVESAQGGDAPEPPGELLAVLAARRGRSAAEIAEFADLPEQLVERWISETGTDRRDVRSFEGRMDRVESAIRRIVGAETTDGVVEAVADLTADMFDTSVVAVYRYDGVRDQLVPVVQSESASFDLEGVPRDGGPLWSAFEAEEPTVVDSDEVVVPAGTFGAVRLGGVNADELGVDLEAFRPVASAAAGSVARLRRIETLQADREELREENEQLRDFASIVSHDLRNPLSVAVGAFEMVVETGEEEYVEQVEEAHERIEGIIEHTLSLAREGRRVDEAESVDLESSAHRAWQAVDTREATLDIAGTTSFEADPDRLRQAFENLFRNAIEHGGDDVAVRVGTLDDGFYVEDDGPGIPPDERDRVFEREFSGAESGSGLGLHIVREVVEGHDWTISVTESDAGGARFEVEGV